MTGFCAAAIATAILHTLSLLALITIEVFAACGRVLGRPAMIAVHVMALVITVTSLMVSIIELSHKLAG